MPILSIVIPAREEEKIIGTTITRLQARMKMSHEIIVSDDCSKDRTAAVAKETGARVVEFCDVRHTPGGSRNRGARVARGEFIAFIDADVNMLDPEAFYQRALKHFEDPDVVGVCGPQRTNPETETWADKISWGILNATLRFQNNVLHKGEASGKNMIVRKSAFQAVHGFREDIATREDGDFFARLSQIGRTIFDSKLVVYHGARRAHRVGWAKLWWIWTSNSVYFALFNRTIADDWTPVR
jgi:glycosyltransferase involved in cell wall biosynthesis